MGKTTIEKCYRLSISRILQDGHLEDGYHDVEIRNHHDMPVWNLLVWIGEGRMTLFETDQRFDLASTRLNFGGKRWWFLCPDCDRRCADLYKTMVGEWFSCRKCLGLAYQSAQEAHSTHVVTSLKLTRWIKVQWTRKRDRRPEYRSRILRHVASLIGEELKDDPQYWRERRTAIRIVREVQEEIREEIRQLREE